MNRRTGIRHGIFFLLWLLLAGPHYTQASVHEGDILDCQGCHSITAPDASSLCLECHANEYPVLSERGDVYTPGGDFFWLSRNYTVGDYISFGDSHGHNVIASAQRLRQDGMRDVAPSVGGIPYQAQWLSCTSCHNPHLNRSRPGTAYRLLGGEGYRGGGMAAGFSFVNPGPVAEPLLKTFGNWIPESDTNHPTYISGMSEWCTNCHGGYLSNKDLSHPAGPMARLNNLANNYRQAVHKANNGSGLPTAYEFLVPFEQGEVDAGGDEEGPTLSANVMCLTCHRAHASPFKAIGRWDLKIKTGLADSPVLTTPEGIHAYYGYSISARYGDRKKTLCALCHPVD